MNEQPPDPVLVLRRRPRPFATIIVDQAAPLHLPDALPCPFCGSSHIIKGERYFAMCVDCGATGPERSADATQRKYTVDWNTRK